MLKIKGITFLFKKEIQEIFDSFTSCFNIRINYFSPDIQELKVGLRKPVCAYCSFVQNELNLKELCIESDKQQCFEATVKKELVYYTCHAGLQEAIHPVFFEETLIGFIVIGQFRNTSKVASLIAQTALQKEISIEALNSAFSKVPQYTQPQIENILNLFKILVKYIVSQHMIARKGNLLLNTIIDLMEEHCNQSITLTDVAKLVGKSNSYISHLFTKNFKKSFRQIFIEMKLDKADEIFKTMPHLTISEVAYMLGYNDPLYFSRIYKKYRRVSPKQFKSTCTEI